MNEEIAKLIEELERLIEAKTVGEWEDSGYLTVLSDKKIVFDFNSGRSGDIEYIVSVSNAVPLLIEYIKAQEKIIGHMREMQKIYSNWSLDSMKTYEEFYQRCANAIGFEGEIFKDFFPSSELDEMIINALLFVKD